MMQVISKESSLAKHLRRQIPNNDGSIESKMIQYAFFENLEVTPTKHLRRQIPNNDESIESKMVKYAFLENLEPIPIAFKAESTVGGGYKKMCKSVDSKNDRHTRIPLDKSKEISRKNKLIKAEKNHNFHTEDGGKISSKNKSNEIKDSTQGLSENQTIHPITLHRKGRSSSETKKSNNVSSENPEIIEIFLDDEESMSENKSQKIGMNENAFKAESTVGGGYKKMCQIVDSKNDRHTRILLDKSKEISRKNKLIKAEKNHNFHTEDGGKISSKNKSNEIKDCTQGLSENQTILPITLHRKGRSSSETKKSNNVSSENPEIIDIFLDDEESMSENKSQKIGMNENAFKAESTVGGGYKKLCKIVDSKNDRHTRIPLDKSKEISRKNKLIKAEKNHNFHTEDGGKISSKNKSNEIKDCTQGLSENQTILPITLHKKGRSSSETKKSNNVSSENPEIIDIFLDDEESMSENKSQKIGMNENAFKAESTVGGGYKKLCKIVDSKNDRHTRIPLDKSKEISRKNKLIKAEKNHNFHTEDGGKISSKNKSNEIKDCTQGLSENQTILPITLHKKGRSSSETKKSNNVSSENPEIIDIFLDDEESMSENKSQKIGMNENAFKAESTVGGGYKKLCKIVDSKTDRHTRIPLDKSKEISRKNKLIKAEKNHNFHTEDGGKISSKNKSNEIKDCTQGLSENQTILPITLHKKGRSSSETKKSNNVSSENPEIIEIFLDDEESMSENKSQKIGKNEKILGCDYCDKQFETKSGLSNHLETLHFIQAITPIRVYANETEDCKNASLKSSIMLENVALNNSSSETQENGNVSFQNQKVIPIPSVEMPWLPRWTDEGNETENCENPLPTNQEITQISSLKVKETSKNELDETEDCKNASLKSYIMLENVALNNSSSETQENGNVSFQNQKVIPIPSVEMSWLPRWIDEGNETENCENPLPTNQEITQISSLEVKKTSKNELDETEDCENSFRKNQDIALFSFIMTGKSETELNETKESGPVFLATEVTEPISFSSMERSVIENEANKTESNNSVCLKDPEIVPISSDSMDTSILNKISIINEEKNLDPKYKKDFPITLGKTKEISKEKKLNEAKKRLNFQTEDQGMISKSVSKTKKISSKKKSNKIKQSKKKDHEAVMKTSAEKFADESNSKNKKRNNETIYTCDNCNKQFKRKTCLTNHMKIHFPAVYTCFACGQEFDKRWGLLDHSIICLKRSKEECKIAILKFNKALNRKEQRRKMKQVRIYKCDICDEEFDRNVKLKKHSATHPRLFLFKCKFCEMTFSYKCELRKHTLIHMGSESINKSENSCESSNEMKRILEEAKLQKKEKGVDFLSCSVCSKQFTRLSNFGIHINQHLKLLKYNCKHCEKVFTDPSSLRRHILTHFDANKNHECPQCSKKFPGKYLLKRHMSLHNEELRRFMCNLCEFRAFTLSDLIHHNRIHTAPSFACDECSLAFHLKCDLEKHKRIHTGIRDLVCEICELKFNSPYNLKRHLKIHDSSNFTCKFCGARYSTSATYEKHLKKHTAQSTKKVDERGLPDALTIYQ